jgi:TRAP-type C4-dicarboxylate transport system permease small subunit
MKHIERSIVVVCQAVMWITTLVIFLILCANTILRYVTGTSVQWASELPELMFPWLVMSGVVLAAAHGAHITTSFLMDTLPAGARRVVGFLVWIAVAALYSTLAVATGRMIEIVHDEKSPILQVPGSVTYGCVLVGMAMLALLALQSAWIVWKRGVVIPHDIPPVNVT